MNCESWLLCSLAHVCKCPYCKQTPCKLYLEEEEFVQTGNGTVAQRLRELEEEE